ncbi:phospholipid phosphatase [Marivirga lumbricoides]|uniref:Phospholipid phosphatase n=1 Tax=Marivirga lumbricoides TaxID=1046115 RepID=A0ABQ1LBT1_9BACT|nr:phospholipid phosphatase [Marivirga lumbricoides]
MKKIYPLILFSLLASALHSQNQKADSLEGKTRTRFKYETLIIPSVLITYGVIGLESHALKGVNKNTQHELKEHIDNQFTVDDISQYAPFITVYGLNALGVKGKNNFKDRTIILGTAYLIMGTTVNVIKATGNEVRPDGSSNNSFPSGHTATAFIGAEFLFQEYKNVSLWYGISGYLVAAGTGFFRMYNDRHWLSDVAAGAGIGILSTKIAYWLHPVIKRTFFKNEEKVSGLVMPYYNGKEYGLGLSMTF